MLRFRLENPCLNRVKPAIVPFDFVEILLLLTIIAHHSDFARSFRVIGRHCPTLSAGAPVFAGIEAECRSLTHRTGSLSAGLL